MPQLNYIAKSRYKITWVPTGINKLHKTYFEKHNVMHYYISDFKTLKSHYGHWTVYVNVFKTCLICVRFGTIVVCIEGVKASQFFCHIPCCDQLKNKTLK